MSPSWKGKLLQTIQLWRFHCLFFPVIVLRGVKEGVCVFFFWNGDLGGGSNKNIGNLWKGARCMIGVEFHNPLPTNFPVTWLKEVFPLKKTCLNTVDHHGFFAKGDLRDLPQNPTPPGGEVAALCCQFGHPKPLWVGWGSETSTQGWTTKISNMFNMSEWKNMMKTRKHLSWIWLNLASWLILKTSLPRW